MSEATNDCDTILSIFFLKMKKYIIRTNSEMSEVANDCDMIRALSCEFEFFIDGFECHEKINECVRSETQIRMQRK